MALKELAQAVALAKWQVSVGFWPRGLCHLET